MSGKEKSKRWAEILSAINATVREMLRGSKEWDGLEPLEPRMMLDAVTATIDRDPLATPDPNPINSEINSVKITFNTAVTGVDIGDFSLTRNGGGNLLTSESITTSDDTEYWLSGLADLTEETGDYVLTLIASGSEIQDGSSNPLSADVQTSWHTDVEAPTVTFDYYYGDGTCYDSPIAWARPAMWGRLNDDWTDDTPTVTVTLHRDGYQDIVFSSENTQGSNSIYVDDYGYEGYEWQWGIDIFTYDYAADLDSGTYEISVFASDAINTSQTVDGVELTVFPNTPSIEPDQSFSVDENVEAGTSVGTVSASDDDVANGDVLTYSITAGNTGDTFAINSTTGRITVNDLSLLDYEITPTHSFVLTVKVEDLTEQLTGWAASEDVTINLTDVHEPPTFSVDCPLEVIEGREFVLTLTATDPGDDPVQAWSVNWGDGTEPSTGSRPSSGDEWGPDITQTGPNQWEARHVFTGPNLVDIRATATGVEDEYEQSLCSTRFLDPTFGQLSLDGIRRDGYVKFGIENVFDYGYDLAIDSYGRIVVAGSSGGQATIAKLNFDGSLDETFGPEVSGVPKGYVRSGISADPMAVMIGDDDSIIMVLWLPSGSYRLIRYASDGTLDEDFEASWEGGFVSGSVFGGTTDKQGNILVVGTNSDSEISLTRYLPSGAADTSFGNNGIATMEIGTDAAGSDVAVDSDGRIVVVGWRGDANGDYDAVLLRYFYDETAEQWTWDTSLGDNANETVVTFDYGQVDWGGRLVLQGDDIYVSGACGNLGLRPLLLDYDDDGILKWSAIEDSSATIGSTWPSGVLIDSAGRILYSYGDTTNQTQVVTRYDANGNRDTGFADEGFAEIAPFSNDCYGFGLAWDPSGGVLIVGSSDNEMAVARLGGVVVKKSAPLYDTTFWIPDNALDGHLVGALAATFDPSPETIAYSITGGNEDGIFAIDADTGQITVADAELLAAATSSTYFMEVQAAANGQDPGHVTVTVVVLPAPSIVGSAGTVLTGGSSGSLDLDVSFPSDPRYDTNITECWIDWGDGTLTSTDGSASPSSLWEPSHTYSLSDPNVETVGYEVTAGVNYTLKTRATTNTGAASSVRIPVVISRGDVSSVPAAPYDLMARVNDDGSIEFSWSVSSAAGNPALFMLNGVPLEGSGSAWSTSIGPFAREYTCAAGTLRAGTTYQFSIVAVNSGTNSLQSNLAIVTAPGAADSAPGGLNVQGEHFKVMLDWGSVTGATGYNVYRAVYGQSGPSTPFRLVRVGTQLPSPEDPFIDDDVETGTDYIYKVTAVTGDMESAPSAGIVALRAPTDVSIDIEKDGEDVTATLSWSAVEGATSYTVYKGAYDDRSRVATDIEDVSYEIDTPDEDSCYWVVAVTEDGEVGLASAAAVIVTPTTSTGKVSLFWGEMANVDHFDIYRGTPSLSLALFKPDLSGSATSFDDYLIDAQTSYSYSVVAVYDNGDQAEAAFEADPTGPCFPADSPEPPNCGLAWEYDNENGHMAVRVSLPETYPTGNIDYDIDYRLYRQVGSGDWTHIPGDTFPYYDSDISADATYRYRIQAVSADGELAGAMSRAASITPHISAPNVYVTHLGDVDQGTRAVNVISWTRVPGATGYNVYGEGVDPLNGYEMIWDSGLDPSMYYSCWWDEHAVGGGHNYTVEAIQQIDSQSQHRETKLSEETGPTDDVQLLLDSEYLFVGPQEPYTRLRLILPGLSSRSEFWNGSWELTLKFDNSITVYKPIYDNGVIVDYEQITSGIPVTVNRPTCALPELYVSGVSADEDVEITCTYERGDPATDYDGSTSVRRVYAPEIETPQVGANSDDDDKDGIADFHDGFDGDLITGDDVHDLDDEARSEEETKVEGDFVPLDVELGASPSGEATIKFAYVTGSTYHDNPGNDPLTDYPSAPDRAGFSFGHQYETPMGGLRLWTTEGDAARPANGTPATVGEEEGSYIASGMEYLVSDLEYDPNATAIRVYAEGLSPGTYDVLVSFDPDGIGPDAAHAFEAQVVVADKVFVAVNNDDDDNDGIVDYADGYDMDGDDGAGTGVLKGLDDEASLETWPLNGGSPDDDDLMLTRVYVPKGLEISYFTISYDQAPWSDPQSDVTIPSEGKASLETPYKFAAPDYENGGLRLWRYEQQQDDTWQRVLIDSGEDLDPAYLMDGGEDWDSDYDGFMYFYVEGVGQYQNGSSITVSCYEATEGEIELCTLDVVVLQADVGVDSSNWLANCDWADQVEGVNTVDYVTPDSVKMIPVSDAETSTGALAGNLGNHLDFTADDPFIRPGKAIQLNWNDVDNDGIPDFADGFNLDDEDDTDDDEVPGLEFTLVTIALPDNLDLDLARIRIQYSTSVPSSIDKLSAQDIRTGAYDPLAGEWGDGAAGTNPGAIRLWTRVGDDDSKRSILPFFDLNAPTGSKAVGMYVPPTAPEDSSADWTGLKEFYGPGDLAKLGFTSQGRDVTLYIEGIAPSDYAAATITLMIDPDGPGPLGFISTDMVRLTVGGGDLDVGSANAVTSGEETPTDADKEVARYEEYIEDLAGLPGKIILVNDGDADNDGVPNFAEDLTDDEVGAARGATFAQMSLQLPNWVDLSQAKFRFVYADSDPSDVASEGLYRPGGDGDLRIWSVLGENEAAEDWSVSGHYIASNTSYSAADLGYDGTGTGWDALTLDFLIEAVRSSDAVGGDRIEIYVDPWDSLEPGGDILLDAVRVTAVQATDTSVFSGAVSLSDGTVSLGSADLISTGYSGPWGQTRTFTNRPAFDYGGLNGSGMVNMPRLIEAGNGVIAVHGSTATYFDRDSDDEYMPRFDAKVSLEAVGEGGAERIVLTEADGSKWTFFDWGTDLPALQRGALEQFTDPAGNATTLSYSSDGRLLEASRGGEGGKAETWFYEYYGDRESPSYGLLQSVTLKRTQGEGSNPGHLIVGEVEYTYYDGTEQDSLYGRPGDLKTVSTFDGPRLTDANGKPMNAVAMTYYRYEKRADLVDSVEQTDLLDPTKISLVVGPEGYQRFLGANGGNEDAIFTASAAALEPYADYYFSYYDDNESGGDDGQVYAQSIRGTGAGSVATDGNDTSATFLYSYCSPSTDAVGFNACRRETTELLPTGATSYLYFNFAGQPILVAAVGNNGTENVQFNTYYRYDDHGRVTLAANPSAVPSFTIADPSPDLQVSVSSGGLVTHYAYYNGDDGGPPGYLHTISVSEGSSTTEHLQRRLSYYTSPIVLVHTDEVFQGYDGAGAVATEYCYSDWVGNLPGTIETIYPPISEENNGTEEDIEVWQCYDDFGRLTWTKDAAGFVSHFEYDDATGAVVRSIVDVNTGLVGDEPFGWETPTGGGSHLVYEWSVDKFGRVVATKAPDGVATTTAYIDTAAVSQVISAGSVGPVTRVVNDRRDGTVEMWTLDAAGAAPLAISRAHTDLGSRVVWSDAYVTVVPAALAFGGLYGCSKEITGESETDPALACFYRTSYSYDSAGRLERTQDGSTGMIARSVYDDFGRVTAEWAGTNDFGWSAGGSSTSTFAKVAVYEYDYGNAGDGNLTMSTQCSSITETPETPNAVTRMRYDYRNRLVEQMGCDRVGTKWTLDNLGRATATEVIADADGILDQTHSLAGTLFAKAKTYFDALGQVYTSETYEVVNGEATNTEPMATNYWYDARGNLARTQGPDELIHQATYNGCGAVDTQSVLDSDETSLSYTQQVYDAFGRLSQVKAGTCSGDAVVVSEYYYDDNRDGTGRDQHRVTGVWQLKASATATSADFVLTEQGYDTAGRPNSTTAPELSTGPGGKTTTVATFDPLGRQTVSQTTRFQGSQGADADVLAQSQSSYDGPKLVQAKTSSITKVGENGTPGASLATRFLRDGLNRVTKVQNPDGTFTKTEVDLLGRVLAQYSCADEGANRDPSNVEDDKVLAQTVYKYDSFGRVSLVTNYTRNPGADQRGSLAVSWSPEDSRRTYTATWYDGLGRVVCSADYGTNGGSAMTDRPTSQPATGNNARVVSKTEYDGFGRVSKTTDNKGAVTACFYDSAGRQEYVVEKYVDFDPDGETGVGGPSGQGDQDQVTKYEYNALSLVSAQTAILPGAGPNQVTKYIYSLDLTDKGCPVPRNDLLRAVIYSDSTDAVANGAFGQGQHDHVEYTYYADGSLRDATDQRGVVHTYAYDEWGRKLSDSADVLDVDNVAAAVTRIEWSYDSQGRTQYVTSFSDPDGGSENIVNQVFTSYDDWGNVTQSWQAHVGGVVVGASPESPSISYNYETSIASNGSGYVRLAGVTYPNQRVVSYTYGGSMNPTSWIAGISITEDSVTTPYAGYTYNGAGAAMKIERPAVTGGLTLDYGVAGGAYGGLDALGRVADQKWIGGNGSTTLDQYTYAYDAASNRTSRNNEGAMLSTLGTAYNEVYEYDDLNRLTSFTRQGTTSGASIAEVLQITPPDGASSDSFGISVAVDGNTAVVGSSAFDVGGLSNVGKVYVFRDYGSGWQQVAEFSQPVAYRHAGDGFGNSVAISGGTIIVGSYADDALGTNSGEAYIFEENQATVQWDFVTRLTGLAGSGNVDAGDLFGYAVAIKGDVAVVTAVGDADDGVNGGRAYVFRRTYVNDQWVWGLDQGGVLAPPVGERYSNHYFGESADISGDRIVIGARWDNQKAATAGAVYVFRYVNNTWTKVAKLMASDGGVKDNFGCAVAIDGDLILAGARTHNAGGLTGCGAAYIFHNDGNDNWQQKYELTAPDKAAGDRFGWCLDMQGDKVVVAAYLDDSSCGRAYVFRRQEGQGYLWEETTNFTGSHCQSNEYFGGCLALWGDRLVIGAYRDEAPGGPDNTGAAYSYGGLEGGRTVQTWDLDAVGNWSATAVNGVTQERNVNLANEIISLRGATDTSDKNIAYDDAGNMTTMPRLPMPGYAPGRLLCQYDAWGRLTAVYEDTGSVAGELDSPGDTLLAEYQYDGRGRRTAKIVREGSGDTWRRTDYYYDESWRVVEERATAGAVSYASAMSAGTVAGEAARAQYLYDPGRGDTPICRFRDADGNDETGPGGLEEALFYTSDANGNVTALVRPDGTVVERYMYDAYGQAHVLNGSAASGADPDGADGLGMAEWTLDPDNVSDWDNEVLFSGYRRDGETGLYQARTRYYDCILGTFISRDPAGFVDGMNLMQYCGGNPINATDPTGLAMIDSPVQAGPTDYINPAVFDYSPPRAPYSGFGIPMDAVGGAGYADLLGAPLTLVGTEGLLTGPLLSDASAAFSVGPFSGRQINAWLGDPVTVYASCNSAFEEAIAVYRHRQMNIARYLMLVSGFSQWDWISAPSGFWDCDDPLRARELEVVRTDLREGYWHRVYSPDAQQGLVLCNIPNHIDTEDDPKLRISGIGLIISGIVGKDGLTGERLTPLQAGVNAGEGTLTFLSWVWLGKWLLSRPEMVCARAPAISGYGQRIVSAEEWSVAGQETTIFANEMLGMNPGMASKYMTKAQYAAGLSDARVAAANRGIAVENYVAREMAMSPRYGAYTRHLGGAYRPDFIMLQNRDWVISDITTNAAVSGHLGRWYGPQSTYWTYDTPQTFTVFPPP